MVFKMKNQQIAEVFKQIADILEIKGENFFRIRAYRRAAQNIENLTEDIDVLLKEKKLDIPGVGTDLSQKIQEMIDTGRLDYFDKIKKTIPSGLLEIMTIPGVGPKTTKLLYDNLSIDSVSKLERAAKKHKLRGVFGLKEKTEENILQGIELIKQGHSCILLSVAMAAAAEIMDKLKKLKLVKKINVAGSLRRKKQTIRDIDILISSTQEEKVIDEFCRLAPVKKILAKGQTKSAILTNNGIQVDLRVVKPDSFGAALVYFTGSKAHNIHIRELAKKRGLKINEYGVFLEKTGKKVAGKTEQDVYKALNLAFIEPEMREDTGEVEASQKHKLPRLVTLADIKADMHMHSNWSDGAYSIEDMAKTAQKRGYTYIVITDHSQSLGIAHGLSPERLKQQINEIRALNKKFKNFKIFSGAEVDIKSDGSLDFEDKLLERLDVVLAAVHTGFKQSKEQLTQRIVKAMQNKFVNIIVHPFGRLINERASYELDFEQIIKAAKDTNTALEINSYPKRLDLDDVHVRRAKQMRVMLAIGTDSHTIEQMNMMELGISVARRGWLEKKDVLNCLSQAEFLNRIKK